MWAEHFWQFQPSLFMSTAIVWFRNDLRVHDNEVLTRAVHEHEFILPVFIFDPLQYMPTRYGWKKSSAARAAFLQECVVELRSRLQTIGGNLLVAHDDPENVLPELCMQYGATTIYAQKEIAYEEVQLETRIAKNVRVPVYYIWGQTLYHLDDATFGAEDTPYPFKEFRKQLTEGAEVRKVIDTPVSLKTPPVTDWGDVPNLHMLGYSEEEAGQIHVKAFSGGEIAGLERLEYYTFQTEQLSRYKWTRNQSLGKDYSSKFSPWMALGALSARMIYWEVKRYEQEVNKNISTWWLIFEVIWRDFFKFMGLKYGKSMFLPGGFKSKDKSWSHDSSLFSRWQHGNTGIPFIDAHMRELNASGYMSNRGRVNCACFLARNYGIDWTWGAAWFEHKLLDYDVCSNWLNWNMQAIHTRYTNPVWQGLKYDAKGEYVRYWLPELASVPDKYVHAPWLAGIKLDYPQPVEVYKSWDWVLDEIKM